jgi:hypothetical protein
MSRARRRRARGGLAGQQVPAGEEELAVVFHRLVEGHLDHILLAKNKTMLTSCAPGVNMTVLSL